MIDQEINRLGIDVSSIIDDTSFKQTPCFAAATVKSDEASLKIIKIFQEHGVDPSKPDNLGQTPLYYASREGNLQTMKALLDAGCPANSLDTYAQTPLFYAIREGHIDAV